jgi:hypothetical protein
MKVLVWCSYGNTSVYDISTPEKFKSVIEKIISAVSDWEIEAVPRIEQHIDKHKDNWDEIKRAFNTLRDNIAPGSHESCEEMSVTVLK